MNDYQLLVIAACASLKWKVHPSLYDMDLINKLKIAACATNVRPDLKVITNSEKTRIARG